MVGMLLVMGGCTPPSVPVAEPIIDAPPSPTPSPIPSPSPPAVVGDSTVPAAPDHREILIVPPPDTPMATLSGRITRRATDGVVWDPERRIGMLAWVSWGWQPNTETDGTVWVTVLTGSASSGVIMVSDTIAVQGDIGRVQSVMVPHPRHPAYPRAIVWFGDGNVERGTIYEVVSDDLGMTWSSPRPVADGSIHALWADRDGRMHAVRIGPRSITDQVWYGRQDDSMTAWQWEAIPISFPLTLVDAEMHPDTGMVLVMGMADAPLPGRGYPLVVAMRDRTGHWQQRIMTDAHAVGKARPITVAWCTEQAWIGGWTSYGTSVVAAAWGDRATTEAGTVTVVASGAGREPRGSDVFTEDVTVVCDPVQQREIVIWSTRWDTTPRRWPPPRHTELAWRDRRTGRWEGIDLVSTPSPLPVLDASRTVMAFSGWTSRMTETGSHDATSPSVIHDRSAILVIVAVDHTNATWKITWAWVAADTIGYPVRS